MSRSFVFAICASVLALACSAGPAPVSRSPLDPSNPAAAEGVAPLVAASGASHAAGAPSRQTESAAVVYACPMHPEVTSNEPGSCPKCNMKLVPQK